MKQTSFPNVHWYLNGFTPSKIKLMLVFLNSWNMLKSWTNLDITTATTIQMPFKMTKTTNKEND